MPRDAEDQEPEPPLVLPRGYLQPGDVVHVLAQFQTVSLTPVLSTNGSIPDADVQVVRVPANQRVQGEANVILDVWVTAKGEARLHHG